MLVVYMYILIRVGLWNESCLFSVNEGIVYNDCILLVDFEDLGSCKLWVLLLVIVGSVL